MRLFASLILFVAGLGAAGWTAMAQAQPWLGDVAPSQISHPQYGWYQVRVRQRVVIRVPSRAPQQRPTVETGKKRLTEQKIGKCIMMNQLVAARPGEGKEQNLELVTKGGQLVRAYLAKGCLAREFYAGTYMEKSLDGKLCVDRDLLHARTGAKCEIDKFRQLVSA